MPDSQDSLLGALSEGRFRLLVIAGNALLVIGLLTMRFCYEPQLPAKPPKPTGPSAADAKAASQRVDKDRAVYSKRLAADSREFRVRPSVTLENMSEVIPYRQSRMRHLLVPKRKDFVEFAGLKLKLRVDTVAGSSRPHMLLDIENTTDTPLAYRVTTRPSKGVAPCSKKQDVAHNAVVVGPKSVETRTECIYRRSWGLEISEIEVMPINLLSYHYLSLVPPTTLGIETRVAGGHTPTKRNRPCSVFLSARNKRAMEAGQLTWRDVVDFFARHSCKTYDFPTGYRAYTSADEVELPATTGR